MNELKLKYEKESITEKLSQWMWELTCVYLLTSDKSSDCNLEYGNLQQFE